MQLARRFHIPVGELMDRMTHAELLYHLVLDSLDPTGDEREDLRVAMQTSNLVNIQISGKKKTKPGDFLLGAMFKKNRDKTAQNMGLKKKFDRVSFFTNLKKAISKQ